MDELKMLRDLLPEPPSPTPDEVAAARGRVLAATAAPAARRPGAPVRRAAVAVAAASAVAAGAVLVSTAGNDQAGPATTTASGSVTAGGGPGTVALSAHRLLLTAAATAEHAPATGAYWHLTTRTGGQIVTPHGYLIDRRYGRQLWLPRAASQPTWQILQRLGAAPVTDADVRAWLRDGSPTHWTIPARRLSPAEQEVARQKAAIYGRQYRKAAPEQVSAAGEQPYAAREDSHGSAGFLGNRPRTLADLAALPTDPRQLAAWLRHALAAAGLSSTDSDMFLEATHLVLHLPVTPAVRSAAFRMLADLPGVRLVGPVRDPLGRAGYAVAMAGSVGTEDRLVLDTRTGEPLATETVTTTPDAGNPHQARAGQVTAYEVVLGFGWTDAHPTLPARRVGPEDASG